MSDRQPQSGDVALDPSEGEVDTAKRVWVKKVLDIDTPRRGGPTIGLQRDPEVAFNRAVKSSMEGLGAARSTPAVDDVTEKAKSDLEAAMSRMVKAGNAKDFGTAMTALNEARTAGETVQTGYIAARDGWPAALEAVTSQLDPATAQARSLLSGAPPDGDMAKALEAATAARGAAEQAAAGDDYRAAYAALPGLTAKTDALGKAAAAEKLLADAAAAFNKRLNGALESLQAAQLGPPPSDLAEINRKIVASEQTRALTLARARDFGTADQALTAAIDAANIVHSELERAVPAWRTAQADAEKALPPLLLRLQALPPGQVEAQAAHDDAQKAATEADAAGDGQDYRAAMKLLATAREATAKLSELLTAAEQKLANEKAAYESKLSTTQAALDAGQQAKSASDAADNAKAALTKALQEMATAVTERRYADALLALDQAAAAAKIITDERDKAKLAFEQAYPAAEQAHTTAMQAHTGKPALDQATLDLKKTADDAKAAAEKARDEGDWKLANAGIKTLTDAVTAFDVAYKAEWVVRDATALKRADLSGRITIKADLDTTNPAHLKAKAAAVAALAKLDAALNGPAATASGLATTAEGAVVTLEACRPDNATQKGVRTDAAAAEVALLTDSAIAGLSVERRAELALELIAKGPPTGAAKTQLHRLYDKAGMDPAFVRKQQAIQTETARKVKDIPGAADLMAQWNAPRNPTQQAAFQTKVEAFLRKAQEEQSKILKINDVPLSFFSTPESGGSITFGQYNPDRRNIELNSHPDGMPSFKRALATILHENTHSHQHNRIDDLKAGKVAPDDPDFGQILMFAVNNEDNGYVPSSLSDHLLYKKQPIEEDAWRQGDDGADVVIAMLNGTFVG